MEAVAVSCAVLWLHSPEYTVQADDKVWAGKHSGAQLEELAPSACVMVMVSQGVWRMASHTCASSEAWASSCCGSQALAGAGRDLGSLHEQTRIPVGQKLLKSAGIPPQLCWSLVPSSLGKATGLAYIAGHCEPQSLPPYGSYCQILIFFLVPSYLDIGGLGAVKKVFGGKEKYINWKYIQFQIIQLFGNTANLSKDEFILFPNFLYMCVCVDNPHNTTHRIIYVLYYMCKTYLPSLLL